MSLLGNLLRNPFFASLHVNSLRRKRGRVSAAALKRKKEKRRLKYINPFAVEHTGEKPFHTWMDARRTKAFFLAYQDFRNVHRFNRNIEEKDSRDIVKTSLEFSDYYYHKWRSEEIQEEKFRAKMKEVEVEFANLPYYLRDELNNISATTIIRSKAPQFLNKYFDQILRIMPDEIAQRMIVGKRLEKVASDTLEMGE